MRRSGTELIELVAAWLGRARPINAYLDLATSGRIVCSMARLDQVHESLKGSGPGLVELVATGLD